MLFKNTLTKSIVLFVVSLFFIHSLQAQFSPPTRISTPYGSATIPGQYHASNFSFGNGEPINSKHKFFIVLLDDSTIVKKTRITIDFNASKSHIEWKEGKSGNKSTHIIHPNETKKIYRLTGFGDTIAGIPLDSIWVFPSKKGKINLFSVTSEMHKPTIGYFQFTDQGEILQITKENLGRYIKDDPEIEKLMEKKKLLKAIKVYNKRFKEEEENEDD